MSPGGVDDRRSDDRDAFEESNGHGDESDDVSGDERSGTGDVPESEGSKAFDEGFREMTVEEVDQRIIDLLSWILDTETRAKIYVYLLATPASTSEEVAKGTGLYPSTVREALAELHEEGRVSREKRKSEGAGNNPYEYTAIKPSELVGGVVDQVQQELNTIFRLDRLLDREAEESKLDGETTDPITITVDDGGTTVLDDGEEAASITTPRDEPPGDEREDEGADESGESTDDERRDDE